MEDRAGNRYPLAKSKRAYIEPRDGLYYGYINGNQLIAISNDIETVEKRLKKAYRNMKITVRHSGLSLSIEEYEYTKLPRIYRMSVSDTKEHGLIIALDDYKGGHYSAIRLFYDIEKVISFIQRKQRNDGNFFVYGRAPVEDFRERVGGLKTMDVPRDLAVITHLRQTIEQRQSAGSHEAFMKRRRSEYAQHRTIEIYGGKEGYQRDYDDDEVMQD